MNTNKITIIFTCISILLIISIPTIYKVVKNHNKGLYIAIENKITEAAEKCYYDEKCLDEKILLKNLYDLKYLKPVSNPITKEFYNENSYIIRNDNTFTFYVKE